MQDPEANLRAAEATARFLEQEGAPAVVIGAVALAAHGYIRQTEDIDLGVVADLVCLRRVADLLRQEGYTVVMREPEGDDPLGGVIDVSGDFGLVQVLSYAGKFPDVIRDALAGDVMRVRPGSVLRVVPLPQLVALKLYAGGLKSKADIVEVLRSNPEADVELIRETCQRYRLGGFDSLLDELPA